jgi:hypothetical protein
MVGLFWLVHGAYTWIHPLPMPAFLAWLWILLAAFPGLMVAFHCGPLLAVRRPGAEPAGAGLRPAGFSREDP